MACPSGYRSYTVQQGDILYDIAQRELGDGNRWREIVDISGKKFGELGDIPVLHPGDGICLPNGSVPPQPPVPGSGRGFTNIVSRETYEAMVPNRNPLYTYDNLVTAAQKYQQFCNEGTDEQRKREAAAFLANIAHETTEAGTLRLEGVTPGVSTSLRR